MSPSPRDADAGRPDQLLLDFGPPQPASLSNFIPGRNAECVAAITATAEALARGQRPAHRFITIWGPAGSGKSHLAGALAASAAVLDGCLLVVDDCQHLDHDAQISLFHRFNERLARDDQGLIAFSDVPPARISVIPELASRLAWGIVFALEPLDDDALRLALQAGALARGLPLADEVLNWLLTHTRRDMRSLQRILERLDHLSLQQHRRITLPLVRALLQSPDRAQPEDPAPGPRLR